MGSDIYQHYRKEESGFVDQVFDWLTHASSLYSPVLTPFLTPREGLIVRQIVNGYEDLQVEFTGGYPSAERQRALIYPLYYQVQLEDFSLAYMQIHYPHKFGELTHQQILGSVMATGIRRDRLGDIMTDGQTWQMIVDTHLATYLIHHLSKIGRMGVQVKQINPEELVDSVEEWEDLPLITGSLRVDNVVSKVYNLSRQRAKEAIQSGQVKVNYTPIDKVDTVLAMSDLVSLRKYGRFRLEGIEGMTRKDKYRINVKLLKT